MKKDKPTTKARVKARPKQKTTTEQRLQRIERALFIQNLKVNALLRIGVFTMQQLDEALNAIEAGAAADEFSNSAAIGLIIKLTELFQAEVAKATDVTDAIARVNAVAAKTVANADALGEAVTLYTPAEPVPPVEPPTEPPVETDARRR